MGVQSGINRLIGTASFGAAAVSRMAASLKDKMAKESSDAINKAKDNYSKEANKTAENKRLIQDRINEIKNKKLDLEEKALKIKARDLRTKDKESKLNAQKVKDKVAAYEEKQAATKPAENVKAASKFEFAPNIQESAKTETQAITPENSTTNIDAKDEDVATFIKVRGKNQNRVMGGQKAWETRKERVTEGNKNPFATFKELEKNLNRKYEDFSPVTWDDARKLGLNKDTVIKFVRGYEDQEGAGVDEIFDQLKTKFKDNDAALSLIQDYEASFYRSGDAEEAAAYSNVDLKDHLYQLTQRLLSGDYKEYDQEYVTQKQLEAAESQDQTYSEEVEATENDKYSVWDDGEIVF